jgi:hypothetical protein
VLWLGCCAVQHASDSIYPRLTLSHVNELRKVEMLLL